MRTAKEICAKAAELVAGDRDRQHGAKLQNFKNIAVLWSAYLGKEVTAQDVALLMVLMKVARTKSGEINVDDYIDVAGYGGIAGEIAMHENIWSEVSVNAVGEVD